MCPAVIQRAADQEHDADADRRVREVERDVAARQRVRHAVAPRDPADDGRERTAAREAAADGDETGADARGQSEQRDSDDETACVDDGRALVRERAGLQQVVGDRRRDDRGG
jgi:hypothetical protein